jgi:DUF917 family protein
MSTASGRRAVKSVKSLGKVIHMDGNFIFEVLSLIDKHKVQQWSSGDIVDVKHYRDSEFTIEHTTANGKSEKIRAVLKS